MKKITDNFNIITEINHICDDNEITTNRTEIQIKVTEYMEHLKSEYGKATWGEFYAYIDGILKGIEIN
jgi:nucleoside-specific outer membrane channel protein Tsx